MTGRTNASLNDTVSWQRQRTPLFLLVSHRLRCHDGARRGSWLDGLWTSRLPTLVSCSDPVFLNWYLALDQSSATGLFLQTSLPPLVSCSGPVFFHWSRTFECRTSHTDHDKVCVDNSFANIISIRLFLIVFFDNVYLMKKIIT